MPGSHRGASRDQIPEMLQALLAERFKLEIHREKKEQNVYALFAGSGGARLKPAEVRTDDASPMALGPDGQPRALMAYALNASSVAISARSATLASLTRLMSRFTARPIVDMTGLEGQYQFNLVFAPEGNPNLPPVTGTGPRAAQAPSYDVQSVFDAVKQYGLRLEPRKSPVEMLVVIYVEKRPTEN